MEEELNVQHQMFNPPQADLWRKLKKYGSTPIKLVENRSRAVSLRLTGVYRIVATGIIIAAGCRCGKCVSLVC